MHVMPDCQCSFQLFIPTLAFASRGNEHYVLPFFLDDGFYIIVLKVAEKTTQLHAKIYEYIVFIMLASYLITQFKL